MVELRDIPETAHLWIQRRKVAYRGLTIGEATAQQRQANTAALNGYLADAAGGVLELPAGATIEVDGSLVGRGDTYIKGNGCTLVNKSDFTTVRYFINFWQGNLDIEHIILRGHTTEEIQNEPGDILSHGIQLGPNTRNNLSGVVFKDWFAHCFQGTSGSSTTLDNCQTRSWLTGVSGGDAAKEWIMRNTRFGPIGDVGFGNPVHHQTYINPDVWLHLDNCHFEDGVGEGWSVHYYGSDDIPAYRPPMFKDSYFGGKVFTGKTNLTIIDNCVFSKMLQVQNDTHIKGGLFAGTVEEPVIVSYRTSGGRLVRFEGVTFKNASVQCEAPHPDGALYIFENCHFINTKVQNHWVVGNQMEINGGLFESGHISLKNGSVHLDKRLHISNDVLVWIRDGGVKTEGDVIYYD